MAKKKITRSASNPSEKDSSSKKANSKKQVPRSKRTNDSRQRLQRVMASAGIGSRRECELIIEEGRVEVDGQVVTTLGVKVDPQKQEVFVDAQKLVVQRLQYFMLNKPPGIVSTSKDPSGRPRVIDLISTDNRVYNVGRLDQSSEGLILVTNDGDLANGLTHPRFGVEKKYHVQVAGIPEASELRKLEQGVYIAEGLARATKAKFLKKAKNGSWLEIVLAEGRNREIRRMLASIGHKVRTLKRVSIGPLKLGDLPKGAHRPLTSGELRDLKKAASGVSRPKRKKPTKQELREQSQGNKTTDSTSKPGKSGKRIEPKKETRRPTESGTRGAGRGMKKKSKSAAKPTGRGAPKRGAPKRGAPKRGAPKRGNHSKSRDNRD